MRIADLCHVGLVFRSIFVYSTELVIWLSTAFFHGLLFRLSLELRRTEMEDDGERQSISFCIDKSMKGYSLVSFLRDNCNIGFLCFFLVMIFPDVSANFFYMDILFSSRFLLILMNLFRFALYFSVLVGPALCVNHNIKKNNSILYLNFRIKTNLASTYQF